LAGQREAKNTNKEDKSLNCYLVQLLNIWQQLKNALFFLQTNNSSDARLLAASISDLHFADDLTNTANTF
jgi:hypothetical protein